MTLTDGGGIEGFYQRFGFQVYKDIALVWKLPSGVLKSLPNLRLMISLGAGTDHLLSQPDLPDVPIVRLVDADMLAAMTEYVLLQVLRFHRDDPLYQEQQRNVEWGAYLPTIGPQRRVGRQEIQVFFTCRGVTTQKVSQRVLIFGGQLAIEQLAEQHIELVMVRVH